VADPYASFVNFFYNIWDTIKEVTFKLVKIPYEMWLALPTWTHWVINAGVIVVVVWAALWFWKHREDWKSRV